MVSSQRWTLRRVAEADTIGLHELMRLPPVYRYLADGAAPPREAVEHWIESSHADFHEHGFGLWLLESDSAELGGCVRLEAKTEPRSAELTYILDPRFWGRGLATRMSWTVMQHAFRGAHVDQIVAGADQPNTASVAVMQRLGMTFLRAVQYPAGPGVEYVFRRGDPAPPRLPETIPFSDGEPVA
jgi:ribosomal-protein-alanine N-acetyltransferase